jgi:hypothetical protein
MLAIRIPANTKGHTLSKVSEFERESKIISFRPHMHLRGKSIKVEFQSSVARSDGTEAEWQTLLSVPRWNFNWQNYYVFKEPIHAPKGSKVRLTATWDNNSDKVIRWGLSNEFEMMMGWMSFIETGE